MNNDNPFDGDELPPGASVFGDVAPQVGASVFGSDELASSDSVFSDVDVDVDRPLERVPADAVEARGASVFGNVESPIGFDDSPRITRVADADSGVDAEEVTLDLRSGTHRENGYQFDDVPDDGEEVVKGREPEVSSADQIEDPEPTAGHSFDDGIEPGEPIALDVDPGDDDGLDAWSDLGSTAPSLSSEPSQSSELSSERRAERIETPPAIDDTELPEANTDANVIESDTDAHAASYPSPRTDDDFFEFDDTLPGLAAARSIPGPERSAGANSDLQPRIVTGAALLAVALIALTVNPILALVLIVVMVAVAAGELFNALRVAGYQPATLLGLAASIAMPLAVYFRGTQAVALILGLTIVFGLIWYIAGVATEMPVMNLGVTVLGVAYVGGLASFGAAMLENARRSDLANDDGTELLLIALVLTIAYDIGAYFSGRSMGTTPLTALSPNKTVEGLIGGAVMTVVASVVFVSLLGQFVSPVSDFVSPVQAIMLGIIAAIMAPLGDLAESLIKRDLGIKDMGAILPGHGGVLDRIDALLFVLPTVYFFALAFVYST